MITGSTAVHGLLLGKGFRPVEALRRIPPRGCKRIEPADGERISGHELPCLQVRRLFDGERLASRAENSDLECVLVRNAISRLEMTAS